MLVAWSFARCLRQVLPAPPKLTRLRLPLILPPSPSPPRVPVPCCTPPYSVNCCEFKTQASRCAVNKTGGKASSSISCLIGLILYAATVIHFKSLTACHMSVTPFCR